jgi:hypothetical protein
MKFMRKGERLMELNLEWFEEALFSAKLKELFILSASSNPKKLSSNLTH